MGGEGACKRYMPGVDYNKEGKPYPENVNGNIMKKVRFPINSLSTSAKGKEFIRIEEEGPGQQYKWKKVYNTANAHQGVYDYSDRSRDWTIGVGHKVKAEEWSRFLNEDRTSVSLSSQEIDDLFEKDIKIMEAGVRKGLTGALLTQYEFDALIAFSFQNGQNRIARNEYNMEDLRKYIYAENVIKAAEFIRDFGPYKDRRGREADMYKKGIYRNKG